MTGPSLQFGIWPGPRGRHVVLAHHGTDGLPYFSVWVVETLRRREGTARKLAEFHSKQFARSWAKQRNEKAGIK